MTAPGAIPPAPVPPPSVLGEGVVWAVTMAICGGAWWHGPVPLRVAIGTVAIGCVLRRPWMLALAGFLLAAALGARSYAGLQPVSAEPYEGPVTLVADPTDTPFGVRVDVRVGDRRLELEADGAAAGTVGRALSGERLLVDATMRPPPPGAAWLVPRHVVGRLDVERAEPLDGGAAPWRAANRFRRLLSRGAESMAEPARSLYGGFVLGDRRGQTPEVVDDFRGAGLTHVLVVSGQNLAFVLVLLSPVIDRLGLTGRWVATIAVIGAFAALTRFEPSVLRASAMAAVAVSSMVAGRPSARGRTLALAVSGLVLIDPLLVRSVAFQLSVAASLGIAVLGPPIVALLRGPRWWRDAVGVTVAAQLGVAPVIIPRFGGLPVVSLVANVLTVPVAGMVTTWGLPAGVVAGLAGPNVARVLHLPTQWMIGWVAGVARIGATVPAGELGMVGLVVVVAGLGGWWAVVRWWPQHRSLRLAAGLLVTAALLAPAWDLRSPPATVRPDRGMEVHRAAGVTVLVLDDPPSPVRVLEGLRRAGVRRLDVVISTRPLTEAMRRALEHRWAIGREVITDRRRE